MAWVYLAVGVVLEVVGTSLLKLSDGFSRIGVGCGALLAYWVCFVFVALALKVIPVGVAYAIWAGLGTAAIAVIGMTVFDEQVSVLKIVFIGMVIAGAVGLNLITDTRT